MKTPRFALFSVYRGTRQETYGIEPDVQITKEGIPVVFHDYSLSRMCGVQVHIRDMSFGG